MLVLCRRVLQGQLLLPGNRLHLAHRPGLLRHHRGKSLVAVGGQGEAGRRHGSSKTGSSNTTTVAHHGLNTDLPAAEVAEATVHRRERTAEVVVTANPSTVGTASLTAEVTVEVGTASRRTMVGTASHRRRTAGTVSRHRRTSRHRLADSLHHQTSHHRLAGSRRRQPDPPQEVLLSTKKLCNACISVQRALCCAGV